MEVVVNTVFGPMSVLKNDLRIGKELSTHGCWDLQEILSTIQFYERYANADDEVILDIGCNIGAWTLPIAHRYPDLKIMSFDCQKNLINCLNETLDLNNITNVQTHVMAISDTVDDICFPAINYDWGSNFGAFELEPPLRNSDFNGTRLPNEFTTIQQSTIDQFDLNNVGLVKIDVEGMELKVIRGALNTLQRCRPVVLFEHHKTNRHEVENLLRSVGYRISDGYGQMTYAVFNR